MRIIRVWKSDRGLLLDFLLARAQVPPINMRLTESIMIAALAVFGGGCTTTEYIQEFHGEIRNPYGPNQTTAMHCGIYGDCDGPSVVGGHFFGFDLGTPGDVSIYLSYPQISSCRKIETEPRRADAWMVNSHGNLDVDLEHSQLCNSGDVADLSLFGGKQLTGTIAVRWNNNSDFNITVDLIGTNGDPTIVRGEFLGYTKTKFEPRSLLFVVGMLFSGERVSPGAYSTNLPAIGALTIRNSNKLETPAYRVTIVRRLEYKATSSDVKCTCVNKEDGKTIQLSGKTIPTRGRGVFGYSFQKGATRILIGCDGELQITQGSKVLSDEQGTWK